MSGKKNYELEIVISGGTDASLSSSVQKARNEIGRLERQAGLSAKSIGDSFGGMSTKGIDALGSMSDKVFGLIAKGGKMAAAGIAGIVGASTMVGMGFEAQMSTVEAISQASASDMKRLTDLAKEMGETTQFTAEEAGQGLEYMAMAGWKAGDMIGGLPGIMNLAAASGEDLGSVSDIVTDAMTAFGMQASEASLFADVLAQASSNSNTNVAMMGETFQYVAPLAGALGYSIQDVAVAAGLMANAGVKGEKAGTAMRTMFTNLAKPTKSMKGYMDKLSISLEDGKGNMKSLGQQVVELRKGFSGLSEAKKTEYAAGIAGKQGMSGLLAVVNASDDDFKNLTDSIDNSTGAAERMADVRLDNLKGDLTLLGSAAQGAGIEIYGGLSQGLRGLTQDATTWVTSFTGQMKTNMPTIQRQIKEFGNSAKEGFAPVIEFGKWCISHPDIIKSTLMGIATAFGTFKVVQGAKAGMGMLSNLSSMISAWPVVAAGLAAGAIAGIVTAVKENNKRLKKEDMARRFGDISLSMEELDETAKMIIGSGNIKRASEAVEELGKIKTLAKDFSQANDDLDRLNWKIGMNLDLDETDQQDYASAIDQMVKGSIDLVEQAQYTATISVQALFGTDSTTGNDLINGFNEMYASINGEVAALGKQLGDAYSAAMEDGVIDVDEAKTIQELQKKLANITQKVSQAQFDAKMERLKTQVSGKDLDVDTFKNVQAKVQELNKEQDDKLGQATDYSTAALQLEYEDPAGNMGEQEYKEKLAAIQNQYQSQTMDNSARGLQWSVDTIADAYKDIFDTAIPNMNDGIDAAMQDAISTMKMGGNGALAWDPDAIRRQLGFDKFDKAEVDGIKDLWKEMQPDYVDLQKTAQGYLEAGKEIPKSVANGLADASVIGAIAGNKDAIWQLMALSASENPEYKKALDEARKDGYELPPAVAAGIDGNMPQIDDSVTRLYDSTQTALAEKFGNMKFDGKLSVNLNTEIHTSAANVLASSEEPAHYAEGGLIRNPTLSWFAEDSPEMAIPLNGSRRSVELWQETGELLGAYETNNYDRMYQDLASGTSAESSGAPISQPMFSLTIQMNGEGGAKDQIEAGASAAFEQFKEFWERLQWEQYRVSL